MLSDFLRAFDQARDDQVLVVRVAENHTRAKGRGDYAEAIPFLLVQHWRRFPDFGLWLLRSFHPNPTDREVRIVGAAAAGRTRVHFRAKPPTASLTGDAAERKNRSVVAVSRAFFVVTVGNGAGNIHKTGSEDRADNFHFVCVLRGDAVRESERKRQRRSVRGRQEHATFLHEFLQARHAVPAQARAQIVG